MIPPLMQGFNIDTFGIFINGEKDTVISLKILYLWSHEP